MSIGKLELETERARADIMHRHNEEQTQTRVMKEVCDQYPDQLLPVLVKAIAYGGQQMRVGHQVAVDGIIRGAFELVPPPAESGILKFFRKAEPPQPARKRFVEI